MIAEPQGIQVQGGRNVQNVSMVALFQVRNALPGHQKCAPSVDIMHQIVTLHIGLLGGGKGDRTGIIHQDIDSAEFFHCTFDRGTDCTFIADVYDAC